MKQTFTLILDYVNRLSNNRASDSIVTLTHSLTQSDSLIAYAYEAVSYKKIPTHFCLIIKAFLSPQHFQELLKASIKTNFLDYLHTRAYIQFETETPSKGHNKQRCFV